MGYAGGSSPHPTYRSIGDHSEAIAIDFDPEVISYESLLEGFFATHNPCRASFSRQYRSAVFFADEAQEKVAGLALKKEAEKRGESLNTALEQMGVFTLAEDYHQKYRLRGHKELLASFEALYPSTEEFLLSSAVTRANAFLAGYGSAERKALDLPRMGLDDSAQAALQR